ncbi:alpha/beta fold hydrolase [Winogradskya humida]|uniref:alpha/beta fold hydrolase n=1 Tax=Winogradskya humida TaxID=113566 RepID=UPI0019452205|nr:alpha/beta hydrolase [Actinoplanes humidus]
MTTIRRYAAVVLAVVLALASPVAARLHPPAGNPVPPQGFSARDANVNGIRMHYVIGGHGPTLVLLHGYPETSYEWFGVLPALGRSYTVIAPDLRGAGGSSAPAGGYDKVTMAADVHALLATLGRTREVNVVGHDIGTMVAYAYAAAYRGEVRKLALTEAPIPDESVYSYPSLTKDGPGFWNFGFFSLTNGLPENTIDGHEKQWVAGFVDWLAVNKAAIHEQDTDVYAQALRDDAHLRASFEWFRAFGTDNGDVALSGKRKLTIPVLAVGADHSLKEKVAEQARSYAVHVQEAVVPDSGHWIWEEQPAYMTELLLTFLAR